MLLASSHIPPSYYTAGVNFNLLTFQTFYSCIPQNVELFSETILAVCLSMPSLWGELVSGCFRVLRIANDLFECSTNAMSLNCS